MPKEITRIAPSGTMAQIVTFALAPDELVGLSGKWATDAELIMDQKYLDLPVFGQFYGSGDLNMEAIAAADPQVIIDIGEYEISMEQLVMWDPEYIIFAPDSVYTSVGEDAAWQGLSAIKNGNYCEAPGVPYNWLGFPPSVNRYIGMIWMSELLYPEEFDYDLYPEAARYYKMFYHCDLSEELFQQITQNAKFKQ